MDKELANLEANWKKAQRRAVAPEYSAEMRIEQEIARLAKQQQREREKQQRDEIKKNKKFYDEWRKGLTGVLIDLHWFRILASQSKVLSTTFHNIGKMLGYLLDIILLPILPSIIDFLRILATVAHIIASLPKWFRTLLAGAMAIVVGMTTFARILLYTYLLFKKLNIELLKNIRLTSASGAGKGGGVIAGVSSNPYAIGAVIGLIGVYLLYITGILGKIYNYGKQTRKWLDSVMAKPLWFIRGSLQIIMGILYGVYQKIKELVDTFIVEPAEEAIEFGKTAIESVTKPVGEVVNTAEQIRDAIVKWVIDSLANTFELGKKILDATVGWVMSGFKEPGELIKKIRDLLLEWFAKECSITFNLAKDLFNIITEFFRDVLIPLKDEIVKFIPTLFNLIPLKDEIVKFIPTLFNLIPLKDEIVKFIPTLFKLPTTPFTLGGGIFNLASMFAPKAQRGGYVERGGLAVIHQGETVIPASSGRDINISITINGMATSQTIDELVKRLKQELIRVRV